MSSFGVVEKINIPLTGSTVLAETGDVLDIAKLSNKAFDYKKGVGAAFTAVLEGSVAGENWTTIDALTASAQGAISDIYNLVRFKCSAGGALGTNTVIKIAGKAL